MANHPLTLDEARGSVRKLLDWADAIQRMRDVLDLEAKLSAQADTVAKDRAAALSAYQTEAETYSRSIAALKQAAHDDLVALETQKAAVDAAKDDLDTTLANARTAMKQEYADAQVKHGATMASLRAEQAAVLKQIQDAKAAQAAEVVAAKAEREQLDADLARLKEAKHRVLSQFAS